MSQLMKNVSHSSKTSIEVLSLLESVGLTKSQALVYLELVKRQSAEASVLCDETGVKNSKIYAILNRLEKLGLIVVESTKPKKYGVVLLEESLENLAKVIKIEYETKIKVLDELKVRLMPLFDSITSTTEFALIIKGSNHVLHHITSKLNTASKNVVFIFPDIKYFNMYENTLKELSEENVKIQLGIHKPKQFEIINRPFDVLLMNCELFYVIIDNNYLIMVSEWKDEELMYAIVTSDRNLIHMSLNYLETPTCLLDH